MRDKLTIMVMKNKISENDKEYKFLLCLINNSIRVFDENFSFSFFINYLAKMQSDKDFSNQISSMIANLTNHDNKDVVLIAKDYFELNYQVFVKSTNGTPYSLFLSLLSSVSQIKKRIELQKNIDKQLGSTVHNLETACA